MRLNRSLLGWGIFFVLLGGIPLAVRQGLLSEATIEDAWRLWPLLLIAGGIGLLLRRTPFEILGGLLSAAVFGVILGSVIATGSLPVGCGGEPATTAIQGTGGELASSADVRLRINCGELTVEAQPGSGWSLEGVADDQPRVSAAASELEIESQSGGAFGVLGDRERWTVRLPTDPAIGLEIGVNAGGATVDLGGANLDRFEVQVNAGSATVDLRDVAAIGDFEVQLNAAGDPRFILPALSFSGSIEANAAGNVRLCPPAGAGLRLIVNDNITASNNYAERGLVRDGDAWETPGYDSATVQIELRTIVNAGSYNLEPEGACGE